MPTPKKGTRLGGGAKHHNMMMSNLATELFRHGRITTTKTKAKTVQPLAEKMITFAKRGDLHARRQVLTVIRDKDVVHKLFADIGPAAAERSGGYTRVIKIGPRKGDGAEMAMIELVDILESDDGESSLTEAPARRWSLRRRRNNLSKTAREREQAIMAAEDSGDFGDDYAAPAAEQDDELVARLSELFGRLEDLSHVLFWSAPTALPSLPAGGEAAGAVLEAAASVDVSLVELPRLRLAFELHRKQQLTPELRVALALGPEPPPILDDIEEYGGVGEDEEGDTHGHDDKEGDGNSAAVNYSEGIEV